MHDIRAIGRQSERLSRLDQCISWSGNIATGTLAEVSMHVYHDLYHFITCSLWSSVTFATQSLWQASRTNRTIQWLFDFHIGTCVFLSGYTAYLMTAWLASRVVQDSKIPLPYLYFVLISEQREQEQKSIYQSSKVFHRRHIQPSLFPHSITLFLSSRIEQASVIAP